MRGLAFFVVVCCLLSATAQVTPVTEQVSYEGQMVGSIELVSDPRINVDAFRALVAQKAGETYSGEKIKASVAALQATRRFTKVDVDVRPEAAGLHVIFVLEPAFYVGILQFPGATRVFTYTRLLQVVNLPDEDPYEKTRIPQAETALLNFLRTNGFFQATVRTETQLDEENQLANITFNVQLKKRARIGRVEVQGPPQQEAARLVRSMRSLRATVTGAALKPGKSYTQERLKSATGRLQKYLAGQRRLASRVRMNPPQYHAETNRADVSFNVEEGPIVDIRTAGAHLSLFPFLGGRRQKKLIPIYDEGAFDRDLVEEGRRNLVNLFQEKGYFDAKVKTVVQHQPDKISLLYQIDKGKRHRVREISFRGNQNLPEDKLLTYIEIRKHHLLSRGRYSEKFLRKSVTDIEALYRDAGYENVKVDPQVVDHEPDIDVTFQIVEGPQTLVDTLRIEGNKTIPFNELSPPSGLGLRSGAPFSPRRLSDDRSRILAAYIDRGYLSAEVKPSITRHPDDPHRVDVTYSVAEHQQVRVSQVVTIGQKRTRQSLISKTADLWPETPLSQGKLLKAESALYDLGIFDWSSVGPRRPISTQTEEVAVIKVHESRRNSITYGVGFEVARRGGNIPTGTVAVPGLPTIGLGKAKILPSEKTFASPRGSVEYSRRNMRGLGETASISLLAARLDQRALATYTQPHFRGSQWKSLISLSGERSTQNPIFTARLGEASWQFERTINRAKTTIAQVRYDFHRTSLSDLLIPELVLPEDRSIRVSGVSGTLIHDTRDKPLDAHQGRFETLDLGINPKAFGSSASFTRLLGQYAYYRPIRKIVWANSVRLGLAKAYGGSHVPASERFFSGGGTSLRGFPINGAGPQRNVAVCSDPNDRSTCSDIRVPVGGNQLFILNSELRFPLPIKNNLGGVLFYDGGNVYHAVNIRSFVRDYTNTIGFGLRYNTPVGPVRFDIGRNLNPVTGISATQFFITLGQAF